MSATWSSARGRGRLAVALLLLALAVLYLLTASRQNMEDANNDVSGAAFSAWRLADTGMPWVDDELGRVLPDVPTRVTITVNEDNERAVIGRTPGVVAVIVPASWLSQQLGYGFGPSPQLVTASLLTTTAVGLLFFTLRRDLGLLASLGGTGAFALASPVWSVNANAMWTHVITVLGIIGMAWATGSNRWWLAGFFGGVTLWGRLHASLIVAVLGIGLAVVRRRPTIALKMGTASAAAMGMASVWNWWHYGFWVPSGGYGLTVASRITGGSADELGLTGGVIPNQLGMWVSPAYGILVWTPVLLVLIPLVFVHRRQVPDWALLLLGGGFVYTVVQAQINIFTGGSGFYGYRHGLEFLACATPAACYSLQGISTNLQRVVAALAAFQFGSIALGAVFDGGYISPEDAWKTNALVEIILEAPETAVLLALLALMGAAVGVLVSRRLRPRLSPSLE